VRQEAVASLRHRRLRSAGALTNDPGHSRGQERGAIDEAVSFTSFDRSIRGAPLDRRLFNVEDANSPWTFSGLVEPSPNTVDL
jgi:hypothetical protein